MVAHHSSDEGELDINEVYRQEELTLAQIKELSNYDLRPQDLDGEHTIQELLPNDPSEYDIKGRHWLYASNPDGGKSEFQLSQDMIPKSDNEAVRKIDEEAYENHHLTGKWNIFRTPDKVDETWSCVKGLIETGELSSAKVSTKWSREQRNQEDHVIIVYTNNYLDKEDVFHVRELLREHCGVDETLYYKPDIYTAKDIYADTAEEMGLPGASRYSG